MPIFILSKRISLVVLSRVHWQFKMWSTSMNIWKLVLEHKSPDTKLDLRDLAEILWNGTHHHNKRDLNLILMFYFWKILQYLSFKLNTVVTHETIWNNNGYSLSKYMLHHFRRGRYYCQNDCDNFFFFL